MSTCHSTHTDEGAVVSLRRYPVKSMWGEELNASAVTARGLVGDRAYALVDQADGKVATAKNPRAWPRLFDCHAAFVEPPQAGAPLPPVRLTLPDGASVTSTDPALAPLLAAALGRDVRLGATADGHQWGEASAVPAAETATAEEYWPDMEGLDYRDTVTDFALPEGTFFDCAVVHVLTTATLARLRALYPQGRFEARRFRPNIVVETAAGQEGFVEDTWIGRTLALGDEVRLGITGPCPRCVMTTLPQGDLPQDLGILRTAAQHHGANVGVYARVLQGGTVHRGDRVRLL